MVGNVNVNVQKSFILFYFLNHCICKYWKVYHTVLIVSKQASTSAFNCNLF